MTPDDVKKILAYASAVDPRIRRNDRDERDLQVAAWHTHLARYDLADAKAAVDQHYAAAAPEALLPGRLRTLIGAIRETRIAALPEAVEPDADPDDWRAYAAALRAGRARVASGAEQARPVRALLERGFRGTS